MQTIDGSVRRWVGKYTDPGLRPVPESGNEDAGLPIAHGFISNIPSIV